ncbi:hypothetical protein [Neorhizobium alkalisoli]|uniref:hypothetical protein n=1 Tax=Neorhizobium alkalisoli TaxID=528178 RepID=UPI000CFA70A8|nr:hypothetical protein [Neorhizobium alkalisoli]
MVAIVVFLFLSGRNITTSMGGVRPGTIGPHSQGWNEVEGGRRRLFCFAMQAEGGGKKLVTDVAGDERGEASLRSDPCQSRSRMERPFQEIGGIRHWWRPLAHRRSRAETARLSKVDGAGNLILAATAMLRAWAREMDTRSCSRTIARRSTDDAAEFPRTPPPGWSQLEWALRAFRPFFVTGQGSSAAARLLLASMR